MLAVARQGEASGFFSGELGYLSEFARCEWIGTRYWPNRLVCHCRSWTWLRFDDADARWYADGHKKAKDEKIPGQQVGILTKHVDKIDFIRVLFKYLSVEFDVSLVFFLLLLFFFFFFIPGFRYFSLFPFNCFWRDLILFYSELDNRFAIGVLSSFWNNDILEVLKFQILEDWKLKSLKNYVRILFLKKILFDFVVVFLFTIHWIFD